MSLYNLTLNFWCINFIGSWGTIKHLCVAFINSIWCNSIFGLGVSFIFLHVLYTTQLDLLYQVHTARHIHVVVMEWWQTKFSSISVVTPVFFGGINFKTTTYWVGSKMSAALNFSYVVKPIYFFLSGLHSIHDAHSVATIVSCSHAFLLDSNFGTVLVSNGF